jgi:2-polyprenyl-3-methyl-5-hydroxy-6-metoxy-1,4-benzoquinol methylase
MAAGAGDGWNHNTHYHRLLLEAVPRPCRFALDVGCGTGGFSRQLATMAAHVDAIDGDAPTLARARALSSRVTNLRIIEADFLTWPADGTYDFVSMIAVLHHLPFSEALTRASALLRPGGVLAVLGLDRHVSWPDQIGRGGIAFATSAFYRATRSTTAVGAPITDPVMTLGEIRQQALTLLPGAVIRRRLLWRYSLVWIKG